MKAKEYITQYRAQIEQGVDDREAIAVIILGLFRDATRIGLERYGKPNVPDHVMLPAIKEQDLKWRAIAHACSFNPNGFKAFMAEKGILW